MHRLALLLLALVSVCYSAPADSKVLSPNAGSFIEQAAQRLYLDESNTAEVIPATSDTTTSCTTPACLTTTTTDDSTDSLTSTGGSGDTLQQALQAIKEDILSSSEQAQAEKTWYDQVKVIVQDYSQKASRVKTHVESLIENIKTLYKKEKQVENLVMQEKLQQQLQAAQSDLSELETALNHVTPKVNSFLKTKEDIQGTIDGINAQLAKLQGTTVSQVDTTTSMDSTDSTSTDSTSSTEAAINQVASESSSSSLWAAGAHFSEQLQYMWEIWSSCVKK